MAKPVKHVDGGLMTATNSDVYIGIDQSLTGFAVTAYAPTTGKFYSWVYTSNNRGVSRLVDIQDFLHDRLEEVNESGHTIVDIGIEASVYQSQSASVLGELAAAVKIYLWSMRSSYPLKVPVTMVKKFATNKGTAKKNEVMLGIYKNWGVEFSDDNMADSYVIARMVAALDGREHTTFVYQNIVIDAIKASPEKFRDS